MEKIFSDSVKYVTALAVACGAFGLVIINLYLQNYSIVDFYVIKPQIILVGFIFTFTLLISFLIYIMFFDLEKVDNNSLIEIHLLLIIKMAVLGNLLNFILNTDNINLVYKESSTSFLIRLLLFGSTVGANTIMMVAIISYEAIVKSSKSLSTKIFFIYPLAFFSILTICGALYNYLRIPQSKNFYRFEAYIAFLVYMFLLGAWASAKDRSRGLDTTSVSFFGKNASGHKPLDKVLSISYFVFLTLFLITNYSKKVYPFVPSHLGGGKPQDLCLIRQSDTLTGKLIYQNSNYLFLLKDTSSILKVDWNKVDQIILKENKKILTNSVPIDHDTLLTN